MASWQCDPASIELAYAGMHICSVNCLVLSILRAAFLSLSWLLSAPLQLLLLFRVCLAWG